MTSRLRPGVWHRTLPIEESRTVVVRARLRHGVITDDRFPLPLDGILAAAARRRALGPGYGMHQDAPDPQLMAARSAAYRSGDRRAIAQLPPEVKAYDAQHRHPTLPLTSTARANAVIRGGKSRWVWAATCAVWDPATATGDVRFIHTRALGGATAESVLGDQMPANPDVGRYKAWRIPNPVLVVGAVEWVALGDPARIEDLLGDITQIGKRKASGEGVVTGWEVVDDGPADWDRIMWRPDGLIARPWPARHAPALGLTDPDTVTVDAYRPPYWRPPLNPAGTTRELVEVIAPWTTRP